MDEDESHRGEWPGLGGATEATPPLVLSSYTLGTEVSYPERVRAAADAGFDGIGLRAENYREARAAGLDDDRMARLARQRGVRVLEVEYLTGWGTTATRDDAQQDRERTIFHMARAFGVGHVNAGLLEHLPLDVTARALAALCDRAGDDLIVALEFMPYSGVPDLAAAWHVVQEAGRANAALLLDVWHWARAGTSLADLDPVPADRIVSLQICDVLARPMQPLREESLGHRLPPGQGHGDAVGLVRALRGRGVRPRIVAVEVISHDLLSRGVGAAARTTADAARAVLRQAGVSNGLT